MIKNSLEISEAGGTIIHDIVGEYVVLKKHGVNYTGCCPFHSEKTPSFNVNPARGIYKCFGCGKGGNAVDFLMEHKGMSYPDALEAIAKKAGVSVKRERTESTEEQKAAYVEKLSLLGAAKWAQDNFAANMAGSPAFKYMQDRGYSMDTMNTFGVGYVEKDYDIRRQPDHKKAMSHLSGELKVLQGADMKNTFRNRATVPYFDERGHVIGWTARTLYSADEQKRMADEGYPVPKWKNSEESKIFTKANALFNLFLAKNAIRKAEKVYLVEGAADVMSVFQLGIENVVAANGTALTDEQIQIIGRYTKNIVLLYDGDQMGVVPETGAEKAIIKNGKRLLQAGFKVMVKLFDNPKADPGEEFSPRKYMNTGKNFEEAIEMARKDFNKLAEIDVLDYIVRFRSEAMKDSENKGDKAQVILDIAKIVALDQYKLTRRQYQSEICDMFGIRKDAFQDIYRTAMEDTNASATEGRREANVHQYMLIGDTYYQIVVDFNPATLSYEQKLISRKSDTIKKHFNNNTRLIERIPMYDGFCNVPRNDEQYAQTYQFNNGGMKSWMYNLYSKVTHKPAKGQWKNIELFLKHIFSAKNILGESLYEFSLDYLQLSYANPTLRLPVICLVSEERNTGKSTFLDFLRAMFGENVAITDNERFTGKFTSHFITKLFVALDEGFIPIEQKLMKERIKNLSIGKTQWSEAKGGTPEQINSFVHLIMASNDEKNFMQIDKGENRFAVIKVQSFPRNKTNARLLQDMTAEIPAFISFLQTRELKYPTGISRFSFPEEVYTTEALTKVMDRTKNRIDKEFDELMIDRFRDFERAELCYTIDQLVDMLNERATYKFDRSKVKDMLSDRKYQVTEKTRRFSTYRLDHDTADVVATSHVGRPYIFTAAEFLPKAEAAALTTGNAEPNEELKKEHTLPF